MKQSGFWQTFQTLSAELLDVNLVVLTYFFKTMFQFSPNDNSTDKMTFPLLSFF